MTRDQEYILRVRRLADQEAQRVIIAGRMRVEFSHDKVPENTTTSDLQTLRGR